MMRKGLPLINPVDRGAEILRDPEAYFKAARERARELVQRDLRREATSGASQRRSR